MSTAPFRTHLRAPDDPRIAGIASMDAYSWADRALANPRGSALFNAWLDRYRNEEFVGITSDGTRMSGLFELYPEGAPVESIMRAVGRLLEAVNDQERARLCHPLDARERRAWMNPEVYLQRHGLRLDEIAPDLRERILELLRVSLSPRGYEKVRNLMHVNHFLGELVNAPRVLNEYSYNFNLFGAPAADAPWGWSFYGHHLCLNCLVVAGQMVLTPLFMGAEPNCIDAGPYAGLTELAEEERLGLALMRGLSVDLRDRAQLYRHKRDPSMPAGRVAVADELHLTGAYRDNRIVPYEGVSAAAFSRADQRQLLNLVATYCSCLPEGPLAAQMARIERHLRDTHFCWIGGVDDDSPFYYRIQSPVILIEFDHHAGVFLGNAEPEKFHIHTLVRTPNGNDYGMELVRQACERASEAR